jgi:hypothetical protein
MVGVLCLKHNLQRAAGRGSVAPDAAACSGREHSIKSKRNVMGPRSYRNCKGLEL